MENQNINQQGAYPNQPVYAPQPQVTPPQKGGIKKIIVPFLITLIASIALVVSMFMPYIVTNNGELSGLDDDMGLYYAMIDLGDLSEISLFEMAEIGFKVGHEFVIVAGLVVILAVFILLMLLFALIKKPIPLLVFCILTFFIYFVLCRIFIASGISVLGYCNWGTAYYTIYAALAVNFVGSIIMMIQRSR